MMEKKMRKHWLAVLFLLGAACLPASALAIDWTVGAGVAVVPDYQGSEDHKVRPYWLVRARDLYDPNTYLTIRGPNLKSNLLPHKNFRLGFSSQYIRKRGDVDNDQVDAMKNTNNGYLVGLVLGYDFRLENKSIVGFELDSRWDVEDDIGGLFTLRAHYRTRLGGPWGLRTSVESTYASKDFMSEYFDVSAEDAGRSGLDTFSADDGIKDVSLNVGLIYRFNKNWSSAGSLRYTRLLNDAADSPVVDDAGDPNQLGAALVVNYRF